MLHNNNNKLIRRSALTLLTAGLLASVSLSDAHAANASDGDFLSPIYALLLDSTEDNTSRVEDQVEDDREAVDFLISASFGPNDDSVAELRSMGYSAWFKRQTGLEVKSALENTIARQESAVLQPGETCIHGERFPRETWAEFAITGEDQLRQRVAFALSQIFVVATQENATRCKPRMLAHYMDVMQDHAFGDFRSLLEEVTYHTFMGFWLTYLNNAKANPATGSEPDENYAREIMQLFSIGLVELNMDGTQKLDSDGNAIESYTQEDVTELAKVFTGLHRAGLGFGANNFFEDIPSDITRLEMDNDFHSEGPKVVLGETIPAYADGNLSISDALDILAEHPNTPPFIAKQLIQRLSTSNPSPAYIEDVANAFKSGVYQLPDGSRIGNRRYGNLEATVAAILFFTEARSDKRFEDTDFANHYGKVREPWLRFTHWARVSGVDTFVLPWFSLDAALLGRLGQDLPYRARSVFNFFRPGYMATGSETAAAGLVAPELQIEFGPNMIAYANGIRSFILRTPENSIGFYPDYSRFGLLDRAGTSKGIIDYFNLIYTGNRLNPDSVTAMVEIMDSIVGGNSTIRVQVASLLVLNSIEFKTQK